MSVVLCPHCGSTATLPLPGLGDRLGAVFRTMFARRGSDLTFGNPELARKFDAGEIGAYCRGCRRRFRYQARPGEASAARSAGDRLRELERLRAEGLISDDEYRHKRAEILREL